MYIWDGNNEIGIDQKQLLILGVGQGAEIGAAVLYELDQTYIPIHDQRGCLVSLITPNTVEVYRYSAFGEQLTPSCTSPWGFCSKRFDEETQLTYFGRRYYSSNLGRFVTPDPQGFLDGPNLYAYCHNSPLLLIDSYGLWSWGSMLEGSRSFIRGASSYGMDMAIGSFAAMSNMGQMMNADFQYEYFNDRSSFLNKSQDALDGWKNAKHAISNDPLGTFFPGFMEASRMPSDAALSDKANAWGKGAIDVGFLTASLLKAGQGAATVSKLGRGTTLKIPSNGYFGVVDNGLNLSKANFNLTPKNFFGSKTYAEMDVLLTNKFGLPKGTGRYNKSFFNQNTGRTFNLHWDPSHRGGKPHIDIRKRGLDNNYYKDNPFFLLEEQL